MGNQCFIYKVEAHRHNVRCSHAGYDIQFITTKGDGKTKVSCTLNIYIQTILSIIIKTQLNPNTLSEHTVSSL